MFRSGSPSLFVKRVINILDTFSAGTELLIRFRLHADNRGNGWGWAIEDLGIQGIATGVAEENRIPMEFGLSQNYPNPFNPETTIRYQLPVQTKVTIQVYNINGQVVRSLIEQKATPAGHHAVKWDGRNNLGIQVSSGTYFYQISTADFKKGRRMLFLR